MSWSLGPPIFGKEQIPVLLKKRKSASEFFGIVSSDAGRAWRKPSVYVIFQDEGALCEAPAPGCTGDGVSSRRKAKRFPAIRSGPGRGDVQNGKRQGNSGGSVKKLRFHQSFSRHGVARASAALFIWLNENVRFQQSFSRHGIARASAALPIWLSENVRFRRFVSVVRGEASRQPRIAASRTSTIPPLCPLPLKRAGLFRCRIGRVASVRFRGSGRVIVVRRGARSSAGGIRCPSAFPSPVLSETVAGLSSISDPNVFSGGFVLCKSNKILSLATV